MSREEFEKHIMRLLKDDEPGDPEAFFSAFTLHPDWISVLLSMVEGKHVIIERVEAVMFVSKEKENVLVIRAWSEGNCYPMIWSREMQEFCEAFFSGYAEVFEAYLKKPENAMDSPRMLS